MPIFLKDLLEKPDLLATSASEKCCICSVSLQETLTGKRKTADGYACSDCYYDRIGAEIEQYPIASAGIRRG